MSGVIVGVSVSTVSSRRCPSGGVATVLRVRLVQRLNVGQRTRELRVISRHYARKFASSVAAANAANVESAARSVVERAKCVGDDVKDEHGKALSDVAARVAAAAQRAGRTPSTVRLVAVSKTKPVELLRECYDAGHRTFGENYVQEIVDKAPSMPADTQWHFIGHLQSNKAKTLLEAVPNLAMIETIDSKKLASKLNSALEAREAREALRVLVQVNTSGEESKHGVEPSECVELAKHITDECPRLMFRGLMTIGMPDYTSKPENFITLKKCRDDVCAALGIDLDACELSMGMSGDFEAAIEMGSTNVRVGSTIFGARDYSKSA